MENNFYICTICSKEKSHRLGLLEAKKRYTSPRINYVLNLATQEGIPTLILSGKYGLISPDKKISDYNLLLKAEKVSQLTKRAIKQAKRLRIKELVFYSKPKWEQGWRNYHEVIERVCFALKIKLRKINLSDNLYGTEGIK